MYEDVQHGDENTSNEGSVNSHSETVSERQYLELEPAGPYEDLCQNETQEHQMYEKPVMKML